jgi:23S rRNA-/tRNA-specific pseudouridylate synthase
VTGKPLRLDVALIKLHPELSRRKAQDAIEKGQVSIDGRVSREPGESVTEQTDIRWDRNRKATPKTRISLPLLYADEDLVIVDKPACSRCPRRPTRGTRTRRWRASWTTRAIGSRAGRSRAPSIGSTATRRERWRSR